MLAYTPKIANWGYHGNARRYFDFAVYGGFSQGTERCLHHYGAPLNSIPVLDAYRAAPDDLHLLSVGVGAVTGTLSAIAANGSSAMAWHGAANLMQPDPTNCDYGVGFYGHARNVGAFVVRHATRGWLCYLCDGSEVRSDQRQRNGNITRTNVPDVCL